MALRRRTPLKFIKRIPLIPGVVAVLLIIGVAYFGYNHFHKPASEQIVTAGNPVAAPRSNPSPPNPNKAPSSNNSSVAAARNSGGATDTNGTATANTSQNQWTTSASGLITVKQPAANSTFKSGDTINGSAKVDTVHYRLSDNKVGVIAQGQLNVVNGNFSGVLNFSPQGTGGRLDIFSTDSQLVEYNEVQINVSF